MGSMPHIHGQPCYLDNGSRTGGTVFWWGEKDSPRYAPWNASLGCMTDGQNKCICPSGATSMCTNAMTQTSNLVSTSRSDRAPSNAGQGASTFYVAAMPGALMSLSANGASSPVLWANVAQPLQSGCAPVPSYLDAFDVSTLPQTHIVQIPIDSSRNVVGEPHGYPTIANGYVYIAAEPNATSRSGELLAFSLKPPQTAGATATSVSLPNAGQAPFQIGSGWTLGADIAPNGNGIDRQLYHWVPTLPNASPSSGSWNSVSGASGVGVSVALNGTPWLIGSTGNQMYKWNGSQRVAFASGFCAISVASGTNDGETWAIHCYDNSLWHFDANGNGTNVALPSGVTATKVAMISTTDATCCDHLPFVLAGNQNIYLASHANGCTSGQYSFTQNGAGSDISADTAVGATGRIYTWNPRTQVWNDIIPSNSPTFTAVAAWAEGTFALAGGTLYMIH
jgi:hypothetical protein